MKFKFIVLACAVLLAFCQGSKRSRIAIVIPTAESEAEYIWRTIQDIHFFEENSYQVSLPAGLLIDDLLNKSKAGSLTENDYEKLQVYTSDSIYNKADYISGYEKIETELGLINKMISEIDQADYKWGFKLFDTYKVNLTLYGPGGSYNPDDGSILIFTTTQGEFKNYENPANTIIHEITHIGIEKSIVNKYQVPHALKERLVDRFVLLSFHDDLPQYRIQEMGENRPDQYLNTKADLKDLDLVVEKIMVEE